MLNNVLAKTCSGMNEQWESLQKPDSQNQEVFQEGNTKEKSMLVGEYDIKMREDTLQCFVKDICVLDNDEIVIADSSNNKLKLLDAEFKITGSCRIQGQPGAMCKTGSSEVSCLVCSLTGSHFFLQFISLSETSLEPINSFIVEKDKFHVGGICYLQDHLFILCSCQEIKVYNKKGSVLRHIFCPDLKGSTVMANIWTDGYDLIVTDGNKRVFILDTDGNRKAKITDKKFQGIYGLSRKSCGQIFVTSYYSHSIITMDTRGKNKQEILGNTDGIKHPQAVAYVEKSVCIIVGSYGTDNIQVYRVH